MLTNLLVSSFLTVAFAAPSHHKFPSNPGYVDIGLINGLYVPSVGIRVGTPPQYVEVEIDTGSSDPWLIAADSDFCQMDATNCGFSVAYDQTKSSTFKDLGIPFNATYYDGASNTGTFITDTLGFIQEDSSIATVRDMTFGLAHKATAFQSFMGLGFDTFESPMYLNDPKWMYPGILSTMYNSKLISSRSFGIYINGVKARNGSLTFGGVDYSKIKSGSSLTPFNMVSTNVSVPPNQYAVQLQSLDLEGENVASEGQNLMTGPSIAFIDTGFFVLAVPEENLGSVEKIFNTTWDDNFGGYYCDCSAGKGKSIKYTFGNMSAGGDGTVAYSIPANDFVIPVEDEPGRCQALISLYSRSNRMQVGSAFFRNIYTVFNQDNYTISFAEANQYSTAKPQISPIVPVADDQKCHRKNRH